MKKKYLIFGMSIFIFLGLVSCASVPSTFKKDVSTNYFTKSKIANFPLVSDLRIGAKKTMPMRLYTKTTLNDAKSNILYDFMKEHSCDVVVEPMFSTESVNRGVGELDVKIEMTGFIGNYANIRNFEPKDSTKFWLGKPGKIRGLIPNNVSDTPTSKKKKGDSSAASDALFWGGLMLLGL